MKEGRSLTSYPLLKEQEGLPLQLSLRQQIGCASSIQLSDILIPGMSGAGAQMKRDRILIRLTLMLWTVIHFREALNRMTT